MGPGARGSILLIIAAASAAYAQMEQNSVEDFQSEGAEGKVILIDLFQPIYPPVARLTNTIGDVVLIITVRRDGSIESASAVSGPPLLRQAALTSAQHSRFECRRCEQELTSHSLTYSFQLVERPDWPCPERSGSRVSQTDDHVTIVDDSALVHPYFSYTAKRPAKS